ncbi:MAG: hypothetical protein WBE92_17855 [Steroidobacteraceae bacterium]
MATLVLTGHPIIGGADLVGSALSLSEWLKGDWAVLYSHPDDFVRCEFELDRWVALARPAFAASRIRPLAVAKPRRPLDCGWVTELTGDARALRLYDPARRRPDSPDFFARRLQEDIESMAQRFVMVVDASLRRRKTYAYDAQDRLPSPLNFVRWAAALRDTPVPQGPPADPDTGYSATWPRKYWQGVFQGQSAA